jgi:hypothetical protein
MRSKFVDVREFVVWVLVPRDFHAYIAHLFTYSYLRVTFVDACETTVL